MAKTVASIEAQIAALMAEKKELEIAERKADKDALGVAESIIGKIVLRIVDADWKRIDPALLEDMRCLHHGVLFPRWAGLDLRCRGKAHRGGSEHHCHLEVYGTGVR